MNCADPHGSACGPVLLGQSWNGPDVGRALQRPEPPAQSVKPDWTKEMPISVTVGPVTSGGNSFFSHVGRENDRAISNNAQSEALPNIAP